MRLDDDLIFISIAAYRDSQLLPTVRDCIQKASNRERLRFGICWQRDSEDASLLLGKDSRFRALDVNWRESRGASWARAEICEFPSDTIPVSWTLWPLTRSGERVPKFVGRFSDQDIAILSDDDEYCQD